MACRTKRHQSLLDLSNECGNTYDHIDLIGNTLTPIFSLHGGLRVINGDATQTE